jgi:hypothetical protein
VITAMLVLIHARTVRSLAKYSVARFSSGTRACVGTSESGFRMASVTVRPSNHPRLVTQCRCRRRSRQADRLTRVFFPE